MKYEYPYRQVLNIGGKIIDVKAKTEEDLNRKIERQLKKIGMREYPYFMPSYDKNIITVTSYFNIVINAYKPGITDQTRTGYISKFHVHIEPYIGDMELRKVTNTMCQMVINKMRNYSKDTVKKVRELLFFVFDCAEQQNLIQLNPARNLKLPATKNPERRRALTPEEYEIVEQNILTDTRYLLFALMLYCGCRPSEAADVTYEGIENGLVHIPGTKTANANRKVPLTAKLQNMLQKDATGYIAKDRHGYHMNANTRRRLWLEFKKQSGLPDDLTPYCLRHTYATHLFRAKVDVRTAQKLLGHASITTTVNVYTHIKEDDIMTAGSLLNNTDYGNI